MRECRGLAAFLILGVGFLSGCGSGFTVGLVANPDPADPGQSVTWTVSVRNDTHCQTVETDNPPPPIPPDFPVAALILGFNPDLERLGPSEFCREVQMGTICPDGSCLQPMLTDALGPEAANRIMAQAHAQANSHAPPLAAPSCETIQNDSAGFIGVCEFNPLNPGETQTAMLTDTAPDTGTRHAAQVALAFGFASDSDCRPGAEIAPGVWLLSGCFPTPENRAPVLSPVALGVVAATLLGIGALALRRRSKT